MLLKFSLIDQYTNNETNGIRGMTLLLIKKKKKSYHSSIA